MLCSMLLGLCAFLQLISVASGLLPTLDFEPERFRGSTTLLSTLYVPSSVEKRQTIAQVLKRNVEIFAEVHLLVQENYSLRQWLELFPELITINASKLHLVHVPAPAPQENIAFRSWNSSAYLYRDFFKYANKALLHRLVVLSNNDIEFPPYSVGTMQALWQPNTASVISRREGPCLHDHDRQSSDPKYCYNTNKV